MYEKQLGRAIYPHIGGHSQKTLRRTLFIFDLQRSEKICFFFLCIYRNIWRRNKYDQIPTDRLICSLENITQPWFAAIKVFIFFFSFFSPILQMRLQEKKMPFFVFGCSCGCNRKNMQYSHFVYINLLFNGSIYFWARPTPQKL